MQPGYLPWLGFFELLSRSDVFVVYDDVQFDSGGWRNRNRVNTKNGIRWLTVPVILVDGKATSINRARIDAGQPWKRKHIKTIEQSYSNTRFFSTYFPGIKDVIERSSDLLVDLLLDGIKVIADFLGLKRTVLFSSQLGQAGTDRVDRLIQICKAVGGTAFYEPAGGKTYLGAPEIERFRQNGIAFEFQRFQHPVYRQGGQDFVSHLSVIDLLFNEGNASLQIIRSGGLAGCDGVA